MARRLAALLALSLVILAVAPVRYVEASHGEVLVIDAAPHIWRRMAAVLVDKLYDPGLGLFRETWGTPEGRCWIWNTEQGEAAQAVVYLGDISLLEDMIEGYEKYMSYNNGSVIYLFSRYVPCRSIRVLSTNPSNFSIGNLIVNVGGDLAGTRADREEYSRVIAIGVDVYKDYTNTWEREVAWPLLGYVASVRGAEVWYGYPGDERRYRGSWDTSNGSLGTGRIIGYSITYNSTYANATRVMSDGRLVYEQQFILEAGKPYIKVYLVVRNNTTSTLDDVRVALAFDEMDKERYQGIYLPGMGRLNASASGGDGVYDIAYSWRGGWRPVNGWLIILLYSNKPLGVNRGLAVMFKEGVRVHVWGYEGTHKPYNGAPLQRYLRRVKFEVYLGSLAPHASRSIEVRVVPMTSYAPGLEGLYTDIISRIDEFEGRDFSYALTTGTGAFKGIALLGVRLAPLKEQYYDFARGVIESAGAVMRGWGWRVSTRVLASYVEALLVLYMHDHDQTLLEEAREAAGILLSTQVRDPSDPRNGGFLDLPPPLGAAAYLDVDAEAAHALLMLYNVTGDPRYKEAVDYWLDNWFHYDGEEGWYYYRYKSPGEAPGPRWYKGSLRDEPPYAQGYFLQALSTFYWHDERLLVSANAIWALLNSEYWVPTGRGAPETNVETQSSAAVGLRAFLEALAAHMGAGVEYVRGGALVRLSYYRVDSVTSILAGEVRGPPGRAVAVAFYIPRGVIDRVYANGSPAEAVDSLQELSHLAGNAYYWDATDRILYVKMRWGESFRVRIHYTSTLPQQTSSSGTGVQTGSPPPPPSRSPDKTLAALLLLALVIALTASTLSTRGRSKG